MKKNNYLYQIIRIHTSLIFHFAITAFCFSVIINSSTFASTDNLLAPQLVLSDLNGREINSADWQGKIIVLDFWATWCAPCITEIPEFNRLQQKYSNKPIKVVSVAAQSGWAKDIKPFVRKHKVQYPVLVGNDEIVSSFQVLMFPTTFLIDQEGKIFRKYSGGYPSKTEELDKDIETLLATSRN